MLDEPLTPDWPFTHLEASETFDVQCTWCWAFNREYLFNPNLMHLSRPIHPQDQIPLMLEFGACLCVPRHPSVNWKMLQQFTLFSLSIKQQSPSSQLAIKRRRSPWRSSTIENLTRLRGRLALLHCFFRTKLLFFRRWCSFTKLLFFRDGTVSYPTHYQRVYIWKQLGQERNNILQDAILQQNKEILCQTLLFQYVVQIYDMIHIMYRQMVMRNN